MKVFLKRYFGIVWKLIKKVKILLEGQKAYSHYEKVIKEKMNRGDKKIRFASYVIFDSTYGMHKVIELMKNKTLEWDYKFVIIPDISRGENHAKETYIKSRDYFVNRYGDDYVIDGWDMHKNIFYNHLNEFDVVYFANPYDGMVHKWHSIKYASTQNVLPIYVSYGYDVGRYTTLERLRGRELNLVWRCFADTTYTYNDFRKYQVMKGKNVVQVGYSKMDAFVPNMKNVISAKRKKILISSHHTVSMKQLPLSNFLKYSEFFLSLPKKYPEIDFVFRPHPLLFTTLINEKIWSVEEKEEYIKRLSENGIVYSQEGSYLDLFSECDAIINDCGSFTIEWLYTGKPGCFMMNEKLSSDYLTPLMNKAIGEYFIAKCEEDIIYYINDVCNNETKRYARKKWVDDNIALNYPNVSQYILNEIDYAKGSFS